MHLYELFAILIYLFALISVGVLSYKRHLTEADFIIGGRSLGSWLTALAAHASDMSSWLFMGYPALVFLKGPVQAWAGIGLLLFMYFNWQWVAPKIRIATEEYGCMTFSSFFESRVADTSGWLRVFTSLMCLLFYTVYLSAGLIGMAYVIGILFNTPFQLNVLIGILIIIPYVFIGGYLTLAWIDLFQGLFLMLAILFVPLYLLPKVGGFSAVEKSYEMRNVAFSLFPDVSLKTGKSLLTLILGMGLGYFGQPHIITKFMGIKQVRNIPRSKMIGMSWMFVSLGAAVLVGFVGSAFFQTGIANPELIFISLVQDAFHPFLIGFFSCAILAATINANGSQILVLASTLSEDLYKRLLRKHAPSSELLMVSRLSVILVGLAAYLIAAFSTSTIFSIVLYAWSGLGCSFGPLILFSLYYKRLNRYGAWGGVLSGGLTVAFWPLIERLGGFSLPPLLPGFFASSCAILLFSQLKAPFFPKSVHET